MKNNIKNYIYPKLILKSIQKNMTDLSNRKRYISVLDELEKDNKISSIGFRRQGNDLLVGINLNPELLMYTEDSQESVELKFISDASKKYTKFLENEGILDSIKADYERVKTSDFYGYIVRITYNSKFNRPMFIFGISYILVTFILISVGLISLVI